MKILFVKLVKRIAKISASLLPQGVIDFYREFRRTRPIIDRSEVVLFASPQTLPGYTPRRPLESASRRPVKVSLISTCYNEAANVHQWLQSLRNQERLPDEVVVCDGGSQDGTYEILQKVREGFPVPLRVMQAPGANIAQGRNRAIESASHPVLACTDFGCQLDPAWLKRLAAPFEIDPLIELSAGYYQAIGDNPVSRLASRFFGIDLEAIDPQTFLPSSRCLAVTRSLWSRAGGYPEWLSDAGEDTLFDLQAKAQPSRWAFVPDARVSWRAPDTLRKLIRTYYRYSLGDGEAGLTPHLYWYKVVEIFWATLIRALALLVGIVLSMLFWPWALLYWAACLLVAGVKLVRDNLPVSAELEAVFYPYTALLELVGMVQAIGFGQGVRNRPKVRARKTDHYRRQLEHILARHPDRQGVVVYPPTHDWGFMFQRPQQMARAFARHGYLHFYCTANERTDAVYGLRPIESNLYLSHIPLASFDVIPDPLVYIGSAWNREALSHFTRPVIIYDHYDELEVSGARIEDHLALLDQAQVVLVSSKILLERARQRRPDALFSPNGVDYTFIRSSRPQNGLPAPEDWKPAAEMGGPVIGYSGALAKWLDYDLIAYLAEARPNWAFVLLGVDYDGSLGKSGVLEHQNVHWLGMKPYQELFKYVWRFDLGTIPFKVNDITRSASPIKLFEYMACGKPVVSTALPEARSYPGALVAENYAQFLEYLETGLDLRTDQSYLQSIHRVARENTWDNRVRVAIEALKGDGESHTKV